MRLHMGRPQMILAGTAVIYNLTRGEQSAQLPIELLNRAVGITLTAIEKHGDTAQLLKNCFLTLCSDTVLHRAVRILPILMLDTCVTNNDISLMLSRTVAAMVYNGRSVPSSDPDFSYKLRHIGHRRSRPK